MVKELSWICGAAGKQGEEGERWTYKEGRRRAAPPHLEGLENAADASMRRNQGLVVRVLAHIR